MQNTFIHIYLSWIFRKILGFTKNPDANSPLTSKIDITLFRALVNDKHTLAIHIGSFEKP